MALSPQSKGIGDGEHKSECSHAIVAAVDEFGMFPEDHFRCFRLINSGEASHAGETDFRV